MNAIDGLLIVPVAMAAQAKINHAGILKDPAYNCTLCVIRMARWIFLSFKIRIGKI